jgi:HEAT repeat protein
MSKSFEDLLKKIATSPEVHTANLYNLSTMGREDLETFQRIWPTISDQRRRDVMQELVEIAEDNFEVDFNPIFLLGLGDDDARVRASAISGLWENENPVLIEPLVHLLRTDEEVIVRAAAATALGQFINLRELEELSHFQVNLAEEALLETIRQAREDVEVRRRAVEAIAFSSESDVDQIIEAAYYDSDDKMRVSAVFAMGRSADIRWRLQVVEELDSSEAEIRFEAVRACGELFEATGAQGKLDVSELVAKLIYLIEEDPDRQVQEMSIWALGHIGGNTAREALETYLESDDEVLAMAADDALYELNINSGSFDLFDFDDDLLEGDLFDDDDFEALFKIDDPEDNYF